MQRRFVLAFGLLAASRLTTRAADPELPAVTMVEPEGEGRSYWPRWRFYFRTDRQLLAIGR